MSKKQFLFLTITAALWGSSFIFLKVLVPVFGPFYVSSFRILISAMFMGIYVLLFKVKMNWKKNIKVFIAIGILNSAIPFVLYSLASRYIPSNLSVILNSTSPMFVMLFGYLILKDKLSVNKIIGLLFGTFGVVIISSISGDATPENLYLGVALCIIATFLYGFSGTLVKKYAKDIASVELTFGSMLTAGLFLLPFGIFFDTINEVTPLSIGYLIFFGLFCTAVPYILYYNLLKQIGPVKALMVTYLMPVFGIAWGYLFLNEVIAVNNLVGLIFILVGIYLISLKKDLRTLFNKRTT